MAEIGPRRAHGELGPADVGLQAERTALAWRRTTASTLVVTALVARLEASAPVGWAIIGLGIVLATWTAVVGTRRSAAAERCPRGTEPWTPGSGGGVLAAGVGCLALGSLCLVAVLV